MKTIKIHSIKETDKKRTIKATYTYVNIPWLIGSVIVNFFFAFIFLTIILMILIVQLNIEFPANNIFYSIISILSLLVVIFIKRELIMMIIKR